MHPEGISQTSDWNVIFDLLKSMGGFFQGFSLEKSANIIDISVSTLKIITWFERYVCWDFLPNTIWSKHCRESKKILILFDHIFFMDQKFLTTEHKLVQTNSNRFYQLVISDFPHVAIAKPIKISNFWQNVRNYWVVRITAWTLVRIFWAYFCFSHL